MVDSPIELQTPPASIHHSSHLPSESNDGYDTAPLNARALPPTDRGFHAWAYLISAFAIELLVWFVMNQIILQLLNPPRSYPFSYGVFLDHYATHEFSHVSSSSLSLVGSLCTGLMYFASLIIMPVIYRYPWYKRHIMWLGVVLCTAGLIGAAFATELWAYSSVDRLLRKTPAGALDRAPPVHMCLASQS